MKIRISIGFVLIIFMQLGCVKDIQQDKVTVFDRINNETINKTLNGISKDSINISCYPTIFEIVKNSDITAFDSLLVFLHYPENILLGDCGIQFFMDPSMNNIQCLSVNNIVSQYSQWNTTFNTALSLTDFKGKGDKYIGYRISSVSPYPNRFDYKYGWIKVELNENNSRLNIKEIATNETINKPILTGQMK